MELVIDVIASDSSKQVILKTPYYTQLLDLPRFDIFDRWRQAHCRFYEFQSYLVKC